MKKILRLYEHDQEIFTLHRQMNEMKKNIEIRLEEIRKTETFLQKSLDLQKSQELNIKKAEMEIHSLEAELCRLDTQKMQMTSQKQIESLETKILSLINKKEGLESEWLHLCEVLENSQQELLDLQKKRDHLRKESEREIQTQNAQMISDQKKLLEFLSHRDGLLDGMPEKLAKIYENYRKKEKYQPCIYELEDENCPRCAMQLSSSVYQRLRYDESVDVCNHCAMILFWPQV